MAVNVVVTDCGGLEPFNTEGDQHALAENWKRWLRAFKLLIVGKAIIDEHEESYGNGIVNDGDYLFAINNDAYDRIDINIGGVRIKNVMIDSGASCNIVGKRTWLYLKQKKIKARTEKDYAEIYGYGQQRLRTLGKFYCNIDCPDTDVQSKVKFTVLDHDGPTLIGRETAETLGVLRVGPKRVNIITKENIVERYPKLFDGLGLLKDYKLKLHIDKTIKPVAQPMRPVPFHLRSKLEEKLQELENLDVIEDAVGPTTWVSPLTIVPKADSDIRVCVDMRRANEAIVRERHPIPTVDELLYKLNGCTVFSKIDLKWGFHQILLDETSRYITTFRTHKGLKRYKRLMFGVTSAPETYQKIIQDIIRDCEGAENIADDIFVFGKDVVEHDKNLHAVLNALQASGLTLNADKCKFKLSKITFFGHELTSTGIRPSEEKIAAITNAEHPTNANEARSFLGLAQYCAKFIPDLSTICRPIQDLTKRNVVFNWEKKQQAAFEKLKDIMTNVGTLAYFRTDCPTKIITDASPVALGAVLVQLQNDLWRVISYASRSLTDVEKRYSQTEKEALAIVWACERFNLYIFGRKFEIESDHQPLECIYGPKSKPSARIERWVLRLQGYDFKVIYRPGKNNIADALSRLNNKQNYFVRRSAQDELFYVVQANIPHALTIEEIEREAENDEEIIKLQKCISTGDWTKEGELLSIYRHVKSELTCCGFLILRGTRIVIPRRLRSKVVDLAHEGHQGIVKTKLRLRSKVWWPRMDREAENRCKACHSCQLVGGLSKPQPMSRTALPSSPWTYVAADILGPLPSGDYIFAIVDYYSRFLEIAVLKTVTSEKIISVLNSIFSRFGYPCMLKTDNGSVFVSQKFKNYLNCNGIEHVTSPPLWPQANGAIECQNKFLMKAIKIAHFEKRNWREEINQFLIAYRSTPQVTTGASPYSLMFGRSMRTKLPELQPEFKIFDEEIRDRDWEKKLQGKHYADNRNNAVCDNLQIGDEVLVRNSKTNKLSPNFKPSPFIIKEKSNGRLTAVNQDTSIQRHQSYFKPYVRLQQLDKPELHPTNAALNGDETLIPGNVGVPDIAESSKSTVENRSHTSDVNNNANTGTVEAVSSREQTARRSSSRISKPPDRYGSVPYF